MNGLLYIHGLGSGELSRKYKLIEETFATTYSCHCAAWDTDTDIKIFIISLFKRYLGSQSLIIIGDSTGGNYAYQLREMLVRNGVKVRLILLNPLLNIANRISTDPFPERLEDSLVVIDKVNNCFLLQSLYDEVIDQTKVQLGEKVIQLRVDDSHRLFTLSDHITYIQSYIKALPLFS